MRHLLGDLSEGVGEKKEEKSWDVHPLGPIPPNGRPSAARDNGVSVGSREYMIG